MKDRIRQLMDYEGLNAAQFAKKVNINTSVLSHLLGGRNNPSYDIVLKILENCPEVNVEWFIRGVGPMLKDSVKVDEYPDLFSTPFISEPLPPITKVAAVTNEVPVTVKEPVASTKDPEIPKQRTNMQADTEYRKENEVKQPEIAPKPAVVQVDTPPKNTPRSIRKIVIFYDDNTYEEFFSSDKSK